VYIYEGLNTSVRANWLMFCLGQLKIAIVAVLLANNDD